jgi:hypothetical protein
VTEKVEERVGKVSEGEMNAVMGKMPTNCDSMTYLVVIVIAASHHHQGSYSEHGDNKLCGSRDVRHDHAYLLVWWSVDRGKV